MKTDASIDEREADREIAGKRKDVSCSTLASKESPNVAYLRSFCACSLELAVTEHIFNHA
jgi:hypothetical protein